MAQCCARRGKMAESKRKRQPRTSLIVAKG